jgi:hypothetical protein
VIIILPTFMKTGEGVQAILWFCPNNLNACNVGITDANKL